MENDQGNAGTSARALIAYGAVYLACVFVRVRGPMDVRPRARVYRHAYAHRGAGGRARVTGGRLYIMGYGHREIMIKGASSWHAMDHSNQTFSEVERPDVIM